MMKDGRLHRLMWVLLAVVFWGGTARADGLTVEVLTQQLQFTQSDGQIITQTFWTFLSGLGPNGFVDTTGGPLPFTIEALTGTIAFGGPIAHNPHDEIFYFPFYGIVNLNPELKNFNTVLFGQATLYDQNGFVTGLPLECTPPGFPACNDFVLETTDPLASAEMDFLETGLGPAPTPTPEPASLLMLGSGLTMAGWRIRRKARKRSIVFMKGA